MKKIVAFVLSVCMLASLLVACGGEKKDAGTMAKGNTEAHGEEKIVEISILTRWSTDAPRDGVIRDRIDRFQQENPGIKVETIMINDEKSFTDKLRTGIATGDVPSVFQCYGGGTDIEYVKNGVMLDLTPYMESDPEWSTAIPDGNYNNWRFPGIEGTFGVPVEYGPNSFFYNKALFEQYHLDPPETIQQMIEVGKVFLENGIIPMEIGAKEGWRGGHVFNQLFMKMLGDDGVMALANHEMKYTAPEVVEVFAKMQEMADMGFFGTNILAVDASKEKADFHSGKSAMHIDGDWYLSEATNSEIADVMGVLPFPYDENHPEYKQHGFGGAFAGLGVSTGMSQEETDAAVELIKYLTCEEAFKEYQAAGGVTFPVPLDPPADANAIVKEYMVSGNDITNFRADIQQYDAAPGLVDTARNAIQGLFSGMTPEEVAQQIQNFIDDFEAK